jgi:hypothetical protein
MPSWPLGLVLALALAACAAPPPPLDRPVVAAEPAGARRDAALPGTDLGAAHVRAREEQRRGIGVPPALPAPGAVDRLSEILRASRPAPGAGPAGPPPPPPPPGGSLSRLSALPASPLANPRGGLVSGRPW